jgi:KDO2-lipid IV(A) lauroyltransferase
MQKLFFYLSLPFIYFIAYLPFPILYLFSDALFFIIYYITKYRKGLIYKNLKNAFPQKTEAEIKKIAKDYYVFFCDFLLETVKMLAMSKTTMMRRVKFTNLDFIEKYAQKKQSIFIMLGHSGSWEWASPSFELQTPFHVLAIYKPLTNKLIDSLVLKLRTRFGQEATSMKNTLRNIIRLKHQLTVTAFIGDQRPNPRDAYWTIFLNQETGFLWGTEKLAQKFNTPVVFAEIIRPQRGFYEVRFDEISDDPQNTQEGEITEKFARKLESQIQENPHLWLWSHNRWKDKKPMA